MSNRNPRNSENLLSDKNIVSANLTGEVYNYYLYVAQDGSWTILREKQDNTEYKYACGSSDADTAFTNRESLTYESPNGFPSA